MPTPPTAVPQWDEEPGTKIDPSKIYLATFKTEMGDIVIQLFADKAPGTVNNLVFLAREGFYDGTAFHRVMSDFMAQGGDPTGTGSGGPGYQFEDEINPTLRFDDGGYLAMANGGPNTNGSQFFILLTDIPNMAEEHTVFGQVTEGLDVAQSVTAEDTIETITIEEP